MNIGKVSENVLKHSVLHQIHTKKNEIFHGAAIGVDCAIFSVFADESIKDASVVSPKMLATCMREAAVATQAEVDLADTHKETMTHLLNKCANNLAAGGAKPIAAAITLLLPDDTEPDTVRRLMAEANEACQELSMQIVGGQSRVTELVNAPFAVVTGYGRMMDEGNRKEIPSIKKVAPGQDIVLSKWIGLEGTVILAKRKKNELGSRYPAYLAEEAADFEKYLSVIPEAATATKSGVYAMHDASEGGIFGALWELAEGAGVGLNIDLKKIPLRQETVEICEFCGINPYELLSGGCLIMVTEDGEALVEALKKEEIPAAVVGRTTDSKDRILCNDDEMRYMERSKRDEIYRIYEEK